MRFWIIIGIFFLDIILSARVPSNNHKGDGIVYREVLDDNSYLKTLREENVSFLFHEAGEISSGKNGELKIALKKFETEEDYWTKLYSFSNYMTIKVCPSLLRNISELKLEKITEELIRQLEEYNRKFDGVILNLEANNSNLNINLKSLITKIHAKNFRVGIQMNLADLRQDTFEGWIPHFCVYSLTPQTPGSKVRLKPKLRLAAKLGRPFYLSINFGEMLIDESNLDISYKNMSKYLKSDSVRLIEETNISGNLWRKYVVKENLKLKPEKSILAGEIIHSVEPSLKMISKVQLIASKIPSFYFSGIIYNLKRIHPRYLLSKSLKQVEPRLDYKLDKTNKDWFLRLRMSNDSLLGSSRGNNAAGLALNTRGFKLQSLDIGAFENLEVNKHHKETRYVFSLSELNALNSSSEVTLRFKPTSETAYDAEISATAWMRPFGSSDNHYYGGSVGSIKPIAALDTIAKPLYKTTDLKNHKSF